MLIKQQNTFRNDLRTSLKRVDVITFKIELVGTPNLWCSLVELKVAVKLSQQQRSCIYSCPFLPRAGRRWPLSLPSLLFMELQCTVVERTLTALKLKRTESYQAKGRGCVQ